MENAVDALKMAFAVIVFVMALSISIYMFSEARETADLVLHSSDITEFMYYEEAVEGTESRIVGLETIVPTLYKYYKENYTVVFRDKNGDYLNIYETNQKNPSLWSVGYVNKYYDKASDIFKVCAFDVDDETKRHEPWTGSNEYYKKNIDAFLSGGTFYYPSGSGQYYQYDSFMKKYQDTKFIENLGEYTYSTTNDEDNRNSKKKRVIIYTIYK